ncbi:MAG: hypothetical protein JW876_02585 [Candidatus Krumholzibacteriota bacterium]|nr:hypothetical protein [Candidatus Krumholzibacteriota bacterium]
MKRWKVWVGVIVLFLSGAAVGSLATGLVIRHNIHRFVRGGPREMRTRFFDRMLKDIVLSEEQRTRIEEISAESDAEIRAYVDGSRKTVGELVDRHRALIRDLLTPAQATIFDRNFEEIERRRHDRGSGPGFPGEPGERDRRPPPPPH